MKVEGSVGVQIPFDSLTEPGCYICNWNGHLLRVPEDGIAANSRPQINLVSTEPLFVTKISDNPFIPLTQAKTTASNFDLFVNF
jgi:hypothetical protein